MAVAGVKRVDRDRRAPIRSLFSLFSVVIAGGLIWAIVSSSEYRGGSPSPTIAFRAMGVANGKSVETSISHRAQLIVDDAARQAVRAPLSSYPFAVHALAAERLGEKALARRLMVRAMHLRPRNAAIRAWLAYSFAQSGDLNSAVQQAAKLYELAPEAAPQISPLLAKVAEHPDGRRAISESLAGTSYLLDVLRAAPPGALGTAAVTQLLRSTSPDQLEVAQARIVQEHFAIEDYDAARVAWSQLLPQPTQSRSLVYDGSFAGLPGSSPFNWTLTSDSDIQTDLVRSGLPSPATALRVQRYGSLSAIAARQTVMLKPKRYRMTHLLKVDGGTSSSQEPFSWEVRCEKPASAVIATLPIRTDAQQSWSETSWTFEVPANCSLTSINFMSRRTELGTSATTAWITSVQLRPAQD